MIDLTNKKKPPKTILTNPLSTNPLQYTPSADTTGGGTTGDFESIGRRLIRNKEYLQQQRQLLCLQRSASGNTNPSSNNYNQNNVAAPIAGVQWPTVAAAAAAATNRQLSRTLSSPLVQYGPHTLNILSGQGGSARVLQQESSALRIVTTDSGTPFSSHVLSSSIDLLGSSGNNNNIQSTTIPRITPNKSGCAEPVNLKSYTKLTTGLAYDHLMLKHVCMCGHNGTIHPEHSGRLQSIWARLNETDLVKRCHRLRSPKATIDEIRTVHTEAHAILFGSNQLMAASSNNAGFTASKMENNTISPLLMNMPSNFLRLSCGGIGVDLDTIWNEYHTATAARVAVGCVLDVSLKTAKGDLQNGFAIVRPPGHHAESNLAMGFCFFNSVAVAAKIIKQRIPEIKKILIIDWVRLCVCP